MIIELCWADLIECLIYGNQEARSDDVPEELIQIIRARILDYGRLSEKSRGEALQGLWRRMQRNENAEINEPAPETQDLPASNPQSQEIIEENVENDSQVQAELEVESTRADESPLVTKREDATEPKRPQVSKAIEPQLESAALNVPVTVLQGIGPRTAQNLSRLGLFTLRDMLYFFPRRYNDYTKLTPINRLRYGEIVTVIGTVKSINTRPVRSGKATLVEALVSDGSGTLRVNWFNSKYFARRLHEGMQVSLSGKVDQYLGRHVMTNPEMEPLEEQHLSTSRIVPVYPLTSQVTQNWLRKQMSQVTSYWAPRILDPIPEEICHSAGLMDLPTALLEVHFPESWDQLESAQDRLSFDEIFMLQLGVLRQKRAWQDRSADRFIPEPEWLQSQLSRLPFPLTTAQNRALEDILHDLASGRPMNRLIQGDVGSGKTVVAALSIASVTIQGAQSSLMAPTSILAEQHYRSMLQLLANESEQNEAEPPNSRLPLQSHEIRLMLGSTSDAEKQEIRSGLADGSIKLVIGTHALIEDPIEFSNLQLVIIDEQHRFGVDQRAQAACQRCQPALDRDDCHSDPALACINCIRGFGCHINR